METNVKILQDERHPACRRCEKAGISCAGFTKDLFVEVEKPSLERAARKRVVGSKKSSLAASGSPGSSSSVDAAVTDDRVLSLLCQEDFLRIRLPDYARSQVSLLPSRDELCIMYFVKYLCKGPLAIVYQNTLSSSVSVIHSRQSMMHTCMLSLARIFYGIQMHSDDSMRNGLRLYGEALNLLRGVLTRNDCEITTEIIIAVFSLSMAEVKPFDLVIDSVTDRSSRRAYCQRKIRRG